MLRILNRDLRVLKLFCCRNCVMPPKKKPLANNNQATISTFFKSEKRCNDDCNDDEKKQKKTKIGDTGISSLSPEQKVRMADSKAKALQKLQNKNVVPDDNCDLGITWENALESEFSKPYYQKLKEFLASERRRTTIYPPEKDVFSWTRYFAIENTKVVIIGQDPYHGPKQAHGLCFSVQIGVPPPPSLVNIYKELEKDIDGFVRPKHGYLVGWASQGVLLLNACLTVVANQANSHKDKGWEKFTDATIKWINSNLTGVVFLLWGNYAQKKASFVDKKRHHVLAGTHPSPLSAHRGFFGCKHFSKTNEYLKSRNEKEIDWNYLPSQL